MEKLETKEAYVVWTNTDLTEGRGIEYPMAICEEKATAIRLGRRNYVQGSNCTITKETIFRIAKKPYGSRWYGPARLIFPTAEDTKIQKRIDKAEKAVKKAIECGLTEEEIKALKAY